MRFQCLNITCGKQFGWTAKKIVSDGDNTTYEYVICPYCGSLDFEEIRNGVPKKTKKEKNVPPVQYPQSVSQFDPADLVQHSWKGKKISAGKWADGSLAYGWDFKDRFQKQTIQELEIQGTINIDKYDEYLYFYNYFNININ